MKNWKTHRNAYISNHPLKLVEPKHWLFLLAHSVIRHLGVGR